MSDFGSLYNVNVGVLGHVDSGKTALVAALSTTLSTAALDKHPQSRERGITLDLGFSSFAVPAPPEFVAQGFDGLQCTLVDCPGHASLIRTVVGGAQIMDAALLVVDVTKGIQTQTAECIVIGEITTETMIVALNKIGESGGGGGGGWENVIKTSIFCYILPYDHTL
jgi:selenocysteine-specific elongation factor